MRTDPHSHFDDLQPRATRWHLRLLVDFDQRILGGPAFQQIIHIADNDT